MTCPPRSVATKDTGGGTGPVDFIKTVRGKQTTVTSGTYTTGASVALKVEIPGSTLTAWVGTGDPKAAIRDSQTLRMQEQKRWHLHSWEADGPGM